ncbi:MAG TPA: hypothetical protein VMZ22_08570 [Acidimicrobiales bacterium]|nr:hypothetical protein [Acidimicrobiales bacterium]
MTPEEAAVDSADAVAHLTGRFMLDMATYQYGAEIGFPGMAFYTGGRGGVLGDVDAQAVTDAFFFFHPDQVKTNWDQAREVMGRDKAALEFQQSGSKWADDHIPDHIDAATLASLAQRVAEAADAADAPVFAGWRRLPVPESPKAAAAHWMNALRELRFALHADALRRQGVSPHDAVSHKQPQMIPIFGWGAASDLSEATVADWEQAEADTNRGMAEALSVLSPDELDAFVALANATYAATA